MKKWFESIGPGTRHALSGLIVLILGQALTPYVSPEIAHAAAQVIGSAVDQQPGA